MNVITYKLFKILVSILVVEVFDHY